MLVLEKMILVLLFLRVCMSQKTFNILIGNNDWKEAVNWNPIGVPTSMDDVYLNNNT